MFRGGDSNDMILKYAFHIGLHLDTYEWNCFKLGRILDTTKLYIMISVWMALTFTQGQRVTWKGEFV